MTNVKASGTRDVPLEFAKKVNKLVNTELKNGTLFDKVTPITKDLLMHWFDSRLSEERKINFHDGQKQAILNTIYIHEVLKAKNVFDMYMSVQPELLSEIGDIDLKKEKYSHKKYCIKMATGTGKTWVLNAILIWQYLNAKYSNNSENLYSKNFLLIAPGLIVYERLLDAYLGKEREDGTRDIEQSDFKRYEELFVPPIYRDEIFGFLNSSVVKKEEISRKVTGDGLIAITNWHLLADYSSETEETNALDNHRQVLRDIIPILPGTSKGHELNSLDYNYTKGKELEYLSNLPDLVVFNDEAHHLHETKEEGQVIDLEWQKSISKIAKSKINKFVQIDFSATPYEVTGSGQKRARHFFPHIICDFDLTDAIRDGLVKTIVLDKRKELGAYPLEYKVERDGKKILSLSEGQRVMIRAGLQKLKILEKNFVEFTADKNGMTDKVPKMMIMCEDTGVVPLVYDFLTKSEGLLEDDVLQIHSNRIGEITQDDWKKDKQKLFNIDKHIKPKVIISVLMLREGFDVNNICVIVPLRSSTSLILLEQTIGRGLRQMWREPEYQEIKTDNRIKILNKKEEPNNYLDILSIVEHPAFIQFYDEYIKNGEVGVITKEIKTKEDVFGDIIKVSLKEDYQKYDLYIPIIVKESEEDLVLDKLNYNDLEAYPISLDNLKKIIPDKDDKFYSEEIMVKTRFGEYLVKTDIFSVDNYNEFISKLVNCVTNVIVDTGKRKGTRIYPTMQVRNSEIAKIIDEYIRHKLFNAEFDPLTGNHWKILVTTEDKIVKHIIKNISQKVYELQSNKDITDAEVNKKYFSEISELKIRSSFSLDVAKCIYPKVKFPSNKGGFEKKFIEFIDRDSEVNAFIKIDENYNDFAGIKYIRSDGLLAHYYPDFIVKIKDSVYIVETKAERDLENIDVTQKRIATFDTIDKINQLKPEDRMNAEWKYALLGEETFGSLTKNGANTKELLEYAIMTKARIKGTLGDYL